MIIACPKCSAGFFVSPNQIGATGRKVKCSKCKHIWYASVEHKTPTTEVIAERIYSPMPPGANLPAIIPVKIPQALYFLPGAFLTLCLITTWLFYPNFTKNLGICGPMCVSENVQIDNVNYDYNKLNKKIIVDYNIVNNGSSELIMPLVQIQLLDHTNKVLKTVYAEQNNLNLVGGTSARVRTEFTSVPEQAEYVKIALGEKMKFWFK